MCVRFKPAAGPDQRVRSYCNSHGADIGMRWTARALVASASSSSDISIPFSSYKTGMATGDERRYDLSPDSHHLLLLCQKPIVLVTNALAKLHSVSILLNNIYTVAHVNSIPSFHKSVTLIGLQSTDQSLNDQLLNQCTSV